MDYKAAAWPGMKRDGSWLCVCVWWAAFGDNSLLPHMHSLTFWELRERCLGDENVKHWSSCVCVCGGVAVAAVEGRVTGWLILMLLRSKEGTGRRGERDKGGERRDREMLVRARSHTQTSALWCTVCLSQWQPVYHVAINLPTITLWCPGWRPQTGVSLFISFHASVSVIFSLDSSHLCFFPTLSMSLTYNILASGS